MINNSGNSLEPQIRVLHIFNLYPNQTMNWAYNLIDHLPSIRSYITARQFLKNNFYGTKIEYIQNPFGSYHKHFKNLSYKHKYWYLGKILVKLSEILKLETNHLTTQIKNHKIQIIHSHFANTGCYYANLVKASSLPYVVSFYGFDYEQLPFNQPSYQKKYQQLFKLANLIICEGVHGASTLKQLGCPHEKIMVVPLGVDVKKIPIIKRSKVVNSLRLIQIASFTEKKGYIYTIKAFHRALKSGKNMHLTLIGKEKKLGANIKSSVVEYINNNNLADKVTLLDSIDYNHLHQYLKDFQVFIHPSCYASDKDCEGGAPIVLLDAQATGMPVISTTHCDIPSEVIHGKTGLLSKEKDIDDIANNILAFYKMDNITYLNYCKAARNHVENEFDIMRSAKKMKKNYIRILNSIR